MHDELVDRRVDIRCRREKLLVEIHDEELHGDESELSVFRDRDPDRFAGIFDNLFVHNKTSHMPAHALAPN